MAAATRHHHEPLPPHQNNSVVCLREDDSRCSEIGLNTFESRDTVRHPQVDVMNMVARGAITKAWNLGLRNPQARRLTEDMYNGGCLDLHGCVPDADDDGFSCTGRVGSMGSAMSKAYDYLNQPMLPGNFEYQPPSYMMGIKNDGPNSVTGWQRLPNGSLAWEENARRENPQQQQAPGCG